jgi:hypothetical protein
MSVDAVKNVMNTCRNLGEVQLGGINLESASAVLLDVSQGSLDQHVAMQPASIAYWGFMKKEAARRLATIQSMYERWRQKKYAEAKVAVEMGTSAKSGIKVEDVKARLVVDNEVEINKWESQIQEAQERYDTLDVWYEAWKQKSFSIRETVAIDEDERYTSSSIKKSNGSFDGGSGSLPAIKEGKIREIIRRRREKEAGK